MDTFEKKHYLTQVYLAARAAGLCKTQAQFADLLEVDRSGLSSAMNGREKNLTDSFIRKIQKWARDNGFEGGSAPEEQKAPDIVIPAATVKMYENLTETIRLQAEMLARMGAGTAPGYTSPKNFRIETK